MKNLKPEILSLIFHEAVLAAPEDLALRSASVDEVIAASRESLRAALHIAQVCGVWREIALKDGRLWSYFVICGQWLPATRPVPDNLLAKTNNVPLNYTVMLKDQDYREHNAAIVDLLIPQQYRWENVSFGWGKKFLPDVPEIRLTNMPRLTTFVLNLPVVDYMRVSIDFAQSTELRRVNISGDFDLLPVAKPLDFLTLPSTLNFRSVTGISEERFISSCLNFLEAAPLLEELVVLLHKKTHSATSPLSRKRQIVRGLQRLKLNYANGILDNIALPSLEALHYEPKFRYDISAELFVTFLNHSRPPLSYLCLGPLDGGSEEKLLFILRLLPTLKHLSLSHWSVSSRFYRELTLGRKVVHCPNLETVRFRGLQYTNTPATCANALIAMLNSRRSVKESFSTVSFSSSGLPCSVGMTLKTEILSKFRSEWMYRISDEITVGKLPYPFATFKVRKFHWCIIQS